MLIQIHQTLKILMVGMIVAIFSSGCTAVLFKPDPDYVDPKTGMEFVLVEGGTCQMGDASDGKARELPVHTVQVDDFAVAMYETTFAQYDLFCETTGRTKPSDEEWGRGQRPVINVSWEDAQAFADWLKQATGLDYSLPSEAQWEYFARAGTTSRFWTGDSLPNKIANCRECGSEWDNRMTAPVGSFRPNPWDIFDTAGNVAEWTLDDWHQGYNGAPTDGSPWLSSGVTEKVYRGGAWHYSRRELASATRDWLDRNTGNKYIGFRLVINNFPLR